ncbi:MAG: aspartyl/asparaginyl beta-hydroxylase domain-containing protein [Chitinophagales bacterium]|nr:aspartyl/asparaginyl beta-hydroxylase domain-containing protein [Chitinophagales bacterium]
MIKVKYEWPEGEELVFLRPPHEEYHGKHKPFYDPENFPELQPLVDNWEKIRDEVLAYENKHKNHKVMSSVSPAEVEGGYWNLMYLKSFNRYYHKNMAQFPFTMSIINQIPNIVFTSINMLSPHTKINPHYGDTNGIVRGHLGLIVPAPYPEIAIHAGGEEHGWEEGKMFCFMNVVQHWVWNNTDGRRFILMFDFVPKAIEHRKNEICARGLGSQSFIYFYKQWPIFRALPEFTHEPLCKIFSAIWRLYLPIQRRVKFLP